MKGKKKLHLGCGPVILPDYVNVDIEKRKGVDLVLNLEKTPWPFAENSFEEVFANHVLEHLDPITGVMKEVHRVCKKGAVVRVIVPYFASPNMWLAPDHKRPFSYHTWEHFPGFEIVRRKFTYLSNKGFMKSRSHVIDFFINLFPVIYERFFCYLLPASEIHVLMRVKK